jgi:glycolate oxidase FAD binding subunit
MWFDPSELMVRVRAGTSVDELRTALAEHGQTVVLGDRGDATVGGVLAVGRSGLSALGHGSVRSTLLEATYVDAWGRLVRAGAPVVKNVSGYDLCRLLVGSLGTLGLLAEVVLRTVPVPPTADWFTGLADAAGVAAVRRSVERPSSILWDGARVWVLVEGHPDDVAAAGHVLAGLGCGEPCDGPPTLPPVRSSLPASAVADLPSTWTGRFLAEVGVGIVHGDHAAPTAPMDPRLVDLHRAVKVRFDPDGRLNPGRNPLGPGAGAP